MITVNFILNAHLRALIASSVLATDTFYPVQN